MSKTLFILIILSLVQAEIKLSKYDYYELTEYLQSVLRFTQFRAIVLIKSNDTDSSLLKALSIIANNNHHPVVLINLADVKAFNGKYNGKFTYEAIFEENRIYLLFMKDIKNFLGVLDEIVKIHFWRNRHRIIVTFQKGPVDEMEEIFKILWKRRIVNIVFIISNKTYTFNPFSGNWSIVLNTLDLFKEKYNNLYGLTLKLSMFETPMDMTPNKKKEYIGRDAFLAKTLVHSMNATYQFLPPRDGITYGLKFSNGSMTGVFNDVASYYADMAINSRLVKLQFENILEPTYPHDREDIACLVPKSSKQPEYKKFTILFPKKIWILLGISMVLYVFIWYFATMIKTRQFFKILFDIIAITIGYPVQDQTGFKLRTILITYRFYIFLLLAAYQGVLTSVLTIPIQMPEINSLSDLQASGLQIIAATRFKDMLQENQGSTLTPALVRRITRVPDDPDIDRVIKKRGHYAIILKETFALRAVVDKDNYKDGEEIYRIMKERPMPSQVCYAARYGSPALPRVNQLLRRFQESGLNEYWKKSTIHLVIIANNPGDMQGGDSSVKVVTLENISASYYLLGIGLSTSAVVFVIEIVVFHIRKKYQNKQNLLTVN